MRASHTAAAVSVTFDEPNLVPVLRLAEHAGLHAAADRRVRLAASRVKITSIAAGMVASADSIDDLGMIRHRALGRLFGGIRAPSTPARNGSKPSRSSTDSAAPTLIPSAPNSPPSIPALTRAPTAVNRPGQFAKIIDVGEALRLCMSPPSTVRT